MGKTGGVALAGRDARLYLFLCQPAAAPATLWRSRLAARCSCSSCLHVHACARGVLQICAYTKPCVHLHASLASCLLAFTARSPAAACDSPDCARPNAPSSYLALMCSP
jgi:hypothetical protein